MKIIVLGHNQIIPHNRSRWLRLAELYTDTYVSVLPPHFWKNQDYGKLVQFEVKPEIHNNYQVIPADVYRPGSGHFVYRTLGVELRRIKPDIIWVYMDPQGYMMQQVLWYRKLFAPAAKVVCCTSTNIPTPLHRFDLRWRYNFALRNIDAFSTGTHEVINRLRLENVTHPILHKVVTGADEQHWRPGEELDLKKKLGLSNFVIGFVGRHEFAKGLPDLVTALEGLEGKWDFLSLGEGTFKGEAERRLQVVRGGTRVHMQGYVPREATPPYYRCMDVLVIASRQAGPVRDPSPVVIMEAGLSGVVVIGSDLAGIPELVGETGFIVPEGDVKELRACLKYLQDNPAIHEQLAQRTYERALEMFSTTAIAHDTYKFLRQLTLA